MVIGPWFVLARILSVLRHQNQIRLGAELPILEIGFGILLMIVQWPKIPPPDWMKPVMPSPDHDRGPVKLRAD